MLIKKITGFVFVCLLSSPLIGMGPVQKRIVPGLIGSCFVAIPVLLIDPAICKLVLEGDPGKAIAYLGFGFAAGVGASCFWQAGKIKPIARRTESYLPSKLQQDVVVLARPAKLLIAVKE